MAKWAEPPVRCVAVKRTCVPADRHIVDQGPFLVPVAYHVDFPKRFLLSRFGQDAPVLLGHLM